MNNTNRSTNRMIHWIMPFTKQQLPWSTAYIHIEGILPKGPYPPCLRMADGALLAGYPRYVTSTTYLSDTHVCWLICPMLRTLFAYCDSLIECTVSFIRAPPQVWYMNDDGLSSQWRHMNAMASQITSNSLFHANKLQIGKLCITGPLWAMDLHVNGGLPSQRASEKKTFPYHGAIMTACWSTFCKSNFKQQLGCRFDIMDNESYFFVFWHMQLYMSWYIRSCFGFTFLNIPYFFKYSCTNIFHRRSLYTFYYDITRSKRLVINFTLDLQIRLTLPINHIKRTGDHVNNPLSCFQSVVRYDVIISILLLFQRDTFYCSPEELDLDWLETIRNSYGQLQHKCDIRNI